MNDKLTLNKLEKLIEVESNLRGEYQQQLDAKDETISPERPEAEEYRESSTPPKILLR